MTDRGSAQGRIPALLAAGPETWTLDDLKSALQSAVELELSTLPPYLCGYWSIEDSSSTAATLIKSIFMEEMVHMGLACNMLVGIGGTPDLGVTMPTYPGPLPGGVRPDLTVSLAGLSKDQVAMYMQIEYPENPLTDATYPTIGAFYDAIAAAFGSLKPPIDPKVQLTQSVDGESVEPMATVDEVVAKIEYIKEQGEGTSQSPDEPSSGPGHVPPPGTDNYAHYYKFSEIYYGHELEKTDGKWAYTGPAIPFPDAYPMAEVPAGGWTSAPQDVRAKLNAFNLQFTKVLTQLGQAWSGDKDKLGSAIGSMFGLQGLATPLMQIEIGTQPGCYGPEFRFLVGGWQ